MPQERKVLTVGQLLEAFKDQPPGTPVLIEGYEGGLSDAMIGVEEVMLDCEDSGCYGPHDYDHVTYSTYEPYTRTMAVVLTRRHNHLSK